MGETLNAVERNDLPEGEATVVVRDLSDDELAQASGAGRYPGFEQTTGRYPGFEQTT